jgi:diguanylate cyclase (GGDEF)-like protein/putative nucleotidyltransferase with HDIG domain
VLQAREASAITSRLLLVYAERKGGRSAVEEILYRCGLQGREAELRDENQWFAHRTKIELFEAAVDVLGEPLATRHMGELALELGVADGLKVALRALGTPSLVYRNVVRANAKFNAVQRMELIDLGRDHAHLRFVDVAGVGFHPLDCEYNVGLLSCVPVLFGQRQAQVTHVTCACHGAEACEYEVSWRPHASYARYALGSGAVGAVAVAAPALLAPPLLPIGAALALGALGASAWKGVGLHRRRWRQLEREVDEQLELGGRLAVSLQDLAGELRLDELLAKITRNAQAAVGGHEFALLIDDDEGAIRCHSSSAVPSSVLRALERWVPGRPTDLSEPLVIDDLEAVSELAPLADDEAMPLGALCAAPLVYRGNSLGALVALSGSSQAFLPRDVDLLRSYALQAAIALTNARLFEAQERLAARDPLTGLLNRRELEACSVRETERCRRHGRRFALALFDLDGFKLINDARGHAGGDKMLCLIADALGNSCRASDLAFRLGGDEFALLLPETNERSHAITTAERASAAMAGIDKRVGVSYGVANWPDDGADLDALLGSADRRLYAMKGARVDHWPSRSPSARTQVDAGQRERLSLASRLSAKLGDLRDPELIATTTVAELKQGFAHLQPALLRAGPDGILRRVDESDQSLVHDPICMMVATSGEPSFVPNPSLPVENTTACSKLAVPIRVRGAIWGVLRLESTDAHVMSHDDLLLADTVSAHLGSVLAVSELLERYESTLDSTIGVLSDALEAKDQYTAEHARDVAGLAGLVAGRLGVPEEEMKPLRYAALLHDVGKIAVPSEILNKPGPLTDAEFEEIKQHTIIGARMLERIPDLEPVLPLIRSAHERWDGTGYPDRLSGEDIPLGARIICACDAFHAMVSDRPYRSALSTDEAIAEMRRCSGSQFDRGVVLALLSELGFEPLRG